MAKTFQFTAGRGEEVVYEESDCTSSGCRSCSMHIDGEECTDCSMQICSNGNMAPRVDCENIEPGARADICSERLPFGSSLVEFLSPSYADDCQGPAHLACADAITTYEGHEMQYVCSCSSDSKGNSRLECNSVCGDLCNDENDVCVRESFVKTYASDGIADYFKKISSTQLDEEKVCHMKNS